MATSSRDSEPHDGEIRLWREAGGWIATDVETGVTSQGDSREAALSNLDDALQLYHDEAGHPPTEEDLEAVGIDPDANSTGEDEPPGPLK